MGKNNIDWEQKASDALDVIAEKVGVGVDHFWPLIIREQMIEGIFTWVFFILAVIVMRKAVKKCLGEEDEEIWVPAAVISGIGVLVSLTHGILGQAFFKAFNPEYHALKEIMELMK